MQQLKVGIVGAGVAALTCAVELATHGVTVEVFEQAARLGPHQCSWFAGGMLAPWCERENAEPLIATLGEESLAWWKPHVADVVTCNGSLVVALGRDAVELKRFAQRTQHFAHTDSELIASLEPDLAGRFHHGLFFADEAHLDTRRALMQLVERLKQLGGVVDFNTTVDEGSKRSLASRCDYVIDCAGFSANTSLDGLRGVKGEMLLLRSHDISLQRTIRLLHPRIPVYIVPRADHVLMVGATMIESDDTNSITARSMLELLSAAYALHPAFGEAEVIEIGTQVRPAFADNLPRIVKRGRILYINGLYRRGFLVAPALARRVTEVILHGRIFPEVMHEDFSQRRLA